MGKKGKFKIAGISVLVGIGVVFLSFLIIIAGMVAFLKISAAMSKKTYNDVNQYASYRSGENAISHFTMVPAADMIFPETITADMDTQDFFMMYYNPWDANYLGYLTVKYNENDYQTEAERLLEYPSTDYIGCYGASGFSDYSVLAMDASDSGFVYAITDGVDTIVYVEMVFPGYGMDIAYETYIPKAYLPEGLDISEDNPTRQATIENK